jgi:hypothetical protein
LYRTRRNLRSPSLKFHVAKAIAAKPIACSLCARKVGSHSRASYSASPTPAALPCPKIAKTPANNGTDLERQFNLAAGFTAADDTLPKRLLTEPAKSGPANGKVNELHKMLPAYYEARGWSADGRPTPETLNRLGL